MDANQSHAITTTISLLESIHEVIRSNEIDARIHPILNAVSETWKTSNTLVGIKQCEVIVACIHTLVLLEPLLKTEKGTLAAKSVIALSVYVSKQARCIVQMNEISPRSLANDPTIVQVYFSIAATFQMKVLVVVTTENIALPAHLADGTTIQQINLCESARVVPAPPGMDYSPDVKNKDNSIFSTIKAVEKQLKARKNVIAVTACFVRGAWTILVGIVGKGLVPCGDTLLPKRFGSYPIILCEYRCIPLHRQRWLAAAPQPQIGGAIAPAAKVCRMGTIGPAVELGDGRVRFIASAHVFKDCIAGERVVLSGMVACAMAAIAAGGGGRDPLTTFKTILCNKAPAEAVQHVQNIYPSHMLSAEQDSLQECATLVAIDPVLDIAAVELDANRTLSTLAWNWTDAGPPNDITVVLNEQSWQKEEFERRLEENVDSVMTYGYGASTGEITGISHHVGTHVVTGNDVIVMRESSSTFGDSGSAMWTINPDGLAKVLGIVNWRGEWLLGGDNVVVTADYIIPAWLLREFISSSVDTRTQGV